MNAFIRQGDDGERGGDRAGMTLVEMLVSLTATLMLLGIVAQLFSMVGRGVNGSRNAIDMAGGMRAVQYKLRQDFVDATALGLEPPLKPEANVGYFELIEGPNTDRIAWYGGAVGVPPTASFEKDSYFKVGDIEYPTGNAAAGQKKLQTYVDATESDDRLVGDVDDILLMTIHSPTKPFVGRLDSTDASAGAVQSPYAEVAWFCVPVPTAINPRLYTLYRRQRIIMATPGAGPFNVRSKFPASLNDDSPAPGKDDGKSTPFPNTAPAGMLYQTDVSCRLEGGRIVPNTLADLTKRENRFLHTGAFPYIFDDTSANLLLDGDRLGEDIILTNVIGFDVRVADKDAEVRLVDNDKAVNPGDAGWISGKSSGERGAFVDLNWGQTNAPLKSATLPSGGLGFQSMGVPVAFFGVGKAPISLAPAYAPRRATYCTWSTHYETNGLDDDGKDGIDQASNGVDDNGNGLVDERAERETSPPYPIRLSAIEVRIRCYEPAARQIRQVTVRHAF